MEHPWFQPGDRVRVRSWEDMEREYGLSVYTHTINVPFHFIREMECYCGREYCVTSVEEVTYGGVRCQKVMGLQPAFLWSNAMLEYANPIPTCEIDTIDALI